MPRQARVVVGVVLFFGLMYAATAQTNDASLPARELQLVLEQVRVLQAQAAQRETALRALQESLTVARAESELLRRQWVEAQLRAQTLGANPGDHEAIAATRRLGVALYEQAELVTQLARLVAAVESNADIDPELKRAKALLSSSTATNDVAVGTLAAATVVDVNAPLRMAVLDVGALQGARVGMPVQVWRGDRLIAELRIVEARRRVSGALIERVERGVTLQVGDRARVAGNQVELKR